MTRVACVRRVNTGLPRVEPVYSCDPIAQRSARSLGSALDRCQASWHAQPAYKGNIPYRVYFPTCNRFQAGVSKAFIIRGT
ncbi:hypothetical protein ACIBL3_03450 [Kribbella sp. NPDC050124]|uniref:hypothetical protein n=1 Tax=Kribbella sp. NPDC050124 TaxID=3364114 RepID=UPI00379D8675